jgi:hypothetical protein
VTRRSFLLGVVVPVLVLTVVGVLGGALWAWWADPPKQTETTPYTAELELGRLFGVEARYTVLGLVLGGLVGAGLAWRLRSQGWVLVVGVTLGAGAAATVSYWLGVWWGPDPVAGLARADLLSGALVITVPGLYLSWPVGALLALWLVVWAADRHPDRSDEPSLSDLPPP